MVQVGGRYGARRKRTRERAGDDAAAADDDAAAADADAAAAADADAAADATSSDNKPPPAPGSSYMTYANAAIATCNSR
jgi:hypothetical protein